jgi:hypothetical protein
MMSSELTPDPKLFISRGRKRFSWLFERERPRIVNNFAASALSGYEFSSSSEEMNDPRFSNLAVVLKTY